jgi:hypothetical protein
LKAYTSLLNKRLLTSKPVKPRKKLNLKKNKKKIQIKITGLYGLNGMTSSHILPLFANGRAR